MSHRFFLSLKSERRLFYVFLGLRVEWRRMKVKIKRKSSSKYSFLASVSKSLNLVYLEDFLYQFCCWYFFSKNASLKLKPVLTLELLFRLGWCSYMEVERCRSWWPMQHLQAAFWWLLHRVQISWGGLSSWFVDTYHNQYSNFHLMCLVIFYAVWGQCSHCFHMHCIMKWLNSQQVHQLCPMCRQEWKFKEWKLFWKCLFQDFLQCRKTWPPF